MKYKLRIYKPVNKWSGDLDHEEFFNTFDEMKVRYKELYQKEMGLLNPTAWEHREVIDNGINWGFRWAKFPDAEMQS